MTCYVIHGLLVRSPIPLPAPVSSSERCDVVVRWATTTPRQTAARPTGELMAAVGTCESQGYTLVREAGEYALRIGELAEFRIDAAMSEITVAAFPHTNPGILSLLLAGNVLATLLTLRGEQVLHASAIALNGRAIAFAGHTGAGKSTLAALFCAEAAALIADDTLRLTWVGEHVLCAGGPAQLRLRPGATVLADRIPASQIVPCADGRTGVAVPPVAGACPLHALLIPSRCPSDRLLRVSRLAPAEALFALLSRCRIGGWRDATVLRARLEGLERLTRTVPVYTAEIPWTRPFSNAIARDIAAAVGLSTKLAHA